MRKTPFVYFIQAGSADGPIKIGCAIDPRRRFATYETWNPQPLTLLGVIPGGVKDEKALHRKLIKSKLRGEWYYPTEEVLEYVKRAHEPPTYTVQRNAPRDAPKDKETIELAIAKHDGNVSKAAVELNCSRRTLQNAMRRFQIPPGKSGRPQRSFAPKLTAEGESR